MQQQDSSDGCDVIVVNYNAGGLLGVCVSSAFHEGVDHVIVVDNASHDTSLSLLAHNFPSEPRLHVICNPENLGFAKACNIGIRASSARNVLFLNPDSALEAGALNRLTAALESDRSIGMVGGLLCNADGSEQPGGRRAFPTPGRAFIQAFGLGRLERIFPGLLSDLASHTLPLPAEPAGVEAISGACMLVKRLAIQDVGLWDEGYFLHCEDLDWCMRFHQKGWKILFVPKARIFHTWGGCSRSRPIFVEWHKHRGMLRFYDKFFREQYPSALRTLVVVGVWFHFVLLACWYGARRLAGFLGMKNA